MKISIVIPFYKGNQYLARLFESIKRVVWKTEYKVEYEIVVVNDSPFVDIELPATTIDTKIVINKQNLGIQGTRINGYNHSSGEWILFLDQDDELVEDGFIKQIELTKNADVVVGNGVYILGEVNKKIFDNRKAMEYLIQVERFIQIRNLIPSPGECLIKRDIVPKLWKENKLIHNGSDDWFLWLLLFKNGAKFTCNEELVYIHNDAGGGNLSADLKKMRESSLEMLGLLEKYNVLNGTEIKALNHAIDFKYYQDTKKLSLGILVKYSDSLMANIKYRLILNSYKRA